MELSKPAQVVSTLIIARFDVDRAALHAIDGSR